MSEYATCEDCGREMQPGAGCLVERVQLDGVGYPRKPYVQEPWDTARACHDCNAWPGQYHHSGCDMEVCPICEGQLISCGHVPDWTPYHVVYGITPKPAHTWHKVHLPIAVGYGHETHAIRMVKARQYGNTCVAIRKLGAIRIPGQPPGEWVVFYIPSGLGLATTRTRAEAEQLAITMEPLLTPLNDQVQTAVKGVRDAYYRRCEDAA